MLNERPKLWKNLLEIFNPPTKICKICLKEIKPKRWIEFVSKKEILCLNCANLFNPVFKRFRVNGSPITAIYYYDSTIRTYLYQFKGCFDYELYPVFLYHFANYLHFLYREYTIVPVPSYIGDDETRGFNHVEMIFSLLNLKMKKVLIKTEHHKQADLHGIERAEIKKYLKVKDNANIRGEKILLVDDVFTSGNTIKSCIKLLKELHPNKIKVLVLSKTTGD